MKVATWGPFVLLNLAKGIPVQNEPASDAVDNEWLGEASEILSTNRIDSSLDYICRREYTIKCNWKV